MDVAIVRTEHKVRAGKTQGGLSMHEVIGFDAGRRIVVHSDLFHHHCIRVAKFMARCTVCPTHEQIADAAFDQSLDAVKIPILSEQGLINKLRNERGT